MHLLNDIELMSIEGFHGSISQGQYDIWYKQLLLYPKEKSLICGGMIFKMQDKWIPLFLYPCRIDQGPECGHILLDIQDGHVNPYFLDLLKRYGGETKAELFKTYFSQLENWRDEHALWLQGFLEDKELPFSFPNKMNSDRYDLEAINEMQDMIIHNRLVCGLIRRSIDVRYLLNDFEDLKGTCDFSEPIKFLFGNQGTVKKDIEIDLLRGFSLSESQARILQNCPMQYVSSVIGPPGTGKTYTMTALAIQLVNQGYNVLVTSNNDLAMDVAHKMLCEQWDAQDYVIRAGRGVYRTTFKKKISKALSPNSELWVKKNIDHLKKEIKKLNKRINEFNQNINNQLESETGISEYILHGQKNALHLWWSKYKLFIKSWQQDTLTSTPLIIDQLKSELLSHELELVKHRVGLNRKITLSKYPKLIKAFKKMLFTRQPKLRKQLQELFLYDPILSVFPLWCVKYQDLRTYFPLEKDIFDFVLFDEGTQVDIAGALPAIQRAQRVICFGDYNQIRKISFLSSTDEENIAMRSFAEVPDDLLYYRDNSLLDLIEDRSADSEEMFVLDEHYRSCPSIISFSNHHYYNDVLKLMKQTGYGNGVQFININGVAGTNGCNAEEGEYILDEIRSRLKQKEYSTIGIISPFRKQVDYLRGLCEKVFTIEEFEKIRLRIDTPYGFQGDERDVVFISIVLNDNAASGSWNYLNSHGIWNVSITRAKKEQYVVYSFNPDRLPELNVIRQYFDFQYQEQGNSSSISDKFIREVKLFLRSLGIEEVETNKIFGGVEADIIFNYEDEDFVIDLVGYPGRFHGYINKYGRDILRRIGKKLIIVLYSDWILKNEQTKNQIKTSILPAKDNVI